MLLLNNWEAAFNWTAEIFNKSSDNLASANGRTNIWVGMWEAVGSRPWGFGYVAGERMFVNDPAHAGFQATTSHNGYLSALFGGGWLALGILLVFLFTTYTRTFRLPHKYRGRFQAVMVVLLFNNFFIPGIGGQTTSVFLFVIALACAPVMAGRPEHASTPITRGRTSGSHVLANPRSRQRRSFEGEFGRSRSGVPR
jgi:O-antigen ligase